MNKIEFNLINFVEFVALRPKMKQNSEAKKGKRNKEVCNKKNISIPRLQRLLIKQ